MGVLVLWHLLRGIQRHSCWAVEPDLGIQQQLWYADLGIQLQGCWALDSRPDRAFRDLTLSIMPDFPGLMCTLGDESAYLCPQVEELVRWKMCTLVS